MKKNCKFHLPSQGIGWAVAIILSYSVNKSICWALLHMLCGWFYTVYWLLSKTDLPEFINQMVTK